MSNINCQIPSSAPPINGLILIPDAESQIYTSEELYGDSSLPYSQSPTISSECLIPLALSSKIRVKKPLIFFSFAYKKEFKKPFKALFFSYLRIAFLFKSKEKSK